MIQADLPWSAIHTVLLDMDGTLLDLHFDNTFFQETVPQAWARQHHKSVAEAKQFLQEIYQTVEGTLAWYDLDYWSQQLGMDIPRLKEETAALIRAHPQTWTFLQRLHQAGLATHLVTNAHVRSLDLKLRHVPLAAYLTSIVSSHALGYPKEDPAFWPLLQAQIGFDPASTLLVDDSEPVLQAAQRFGLGFLRHIAAPSSTQPPQPSRQFVSVLRLDALLPGLVGQQS
ncbi:MAG: GMP/IMP nucleotidase [Magnetococcales bacterium]|nr:GMP/IMP nucleotidase [Magnetococcales bacterium]